MFSMNLNAQKVKQMIIYCGLKLSIHYLHQLELKPKINAYVILNFKEKVVQGNNT